MIEELERNDIVLGDRLLFQYNVWNKTKVLNITHIFVKDDADAKQIDKFAQGLNLTKININTLSESAINWVKKNGYTFQRKLVDSVTGKIYFIYEKTVADSIPNTPPVIDIMPIGPITLPTASISLDANVIDDNLPTGTLTFNWSVASKPENSIVSFTDENSVKTIANFNDSGTYILRLTASDGELSSTKDIPIIVNPIIVPQAEEAVATFTTEIPQRLF